MAQNKASNANGHATRTAQTKASLIQVAIDMFGDGGFDSVSTRQLANKANVNISAIAYHFDGKAELFDAAVGAIAQYCQNLMKDVSQQLLTNVPTAPDERLRDAIRAYFGVLFAGNEPQSWVNFFVRCSVDAPQAYDTIYEAAFRPLEMTLAENIAEHLSIPVESEEVKLRAYITTHAIISMRTNRETFLRHIGWTSLGPSQLRLLDGIVTSMVSNALIPA